MKNLLTHFRPQTPKSGIPHDPGIYDRKLTLKAEIIKQ